MKKSNAISNKLSALVDKIEHFVNYCISGVWTDHRQTIRVRLIRTINLSVNSFLDRGLQIKSMSLTYSSILALVPAIALLVAIGRGFGLQNYLQDELYNFFPSQHTAISAALSFVDSYLNQASQGIFVGAGIIFLLWTVISLLSYIEDSFNAIWDVKHERPFFKKITDYISICLILPVLMICSSGVSIFMSTTLQDNLYFPFLSPLVNFILELAPFILCWIAFTLAYLLIPNTKVNIKYAAISGIICATAFQILQLLFVNGQIYVSKYNAIYGSFAFLPLLLIWLQLSWLILLAGCVLTYSLQNVFKFNFNNNSEKISFTARREIALIIMGVIVKTFVKQETPPTKVDIAVKYNLPIRLVNNIIDKFHDAKITYSVKLENGVFGETPAMEIQNYTLAEFFAAFDNEGDASIMPEINNIYAPLFKLLTDLNNKSYDVYSTTLVKDIPIPSPSAIHDYLLGDTETKDTSEQLNGEVTQP